MLMTYLEGRAVVLARHDLSDVAHPHTAHALTEQVIAGVAFEPATIEGRSAISFLVLITSVQCGGRACASHGSSSPKQVSDLTNRWYADSAKLQQNSPL